MPPRKSRSVSSALNPSAPSSASNIASRDGATPVVALPSGTTSNESPIVTEAHKGRPEQRVKRKAEILVEAATSPSKSTRISKKVNHKEEDEDNSEDLVSSQYFEDAQGVSVSGTIAQRKGSNIKHKIRTDSTTASKSVTVSKRDRNAESSSKKPGKIRQEAVKSEDQKAEESGEESKKLKRKRKTKEEKEKEAMPLAARTQGLRMYIGAHVSAAGGVHNAIPNAIHIGGNSFALFLKSQRKWENPALKDEHLDQFLSFCKDHRYDAQSHVLPHGSYLVNLAAADTQKAKQAYDSFLDDLQRCESLGIRLYNFHPGNTNSESRPEAIQRIATALNRAHRSTKSVKTVLETMASRGNVIGGTFEDLRDIIQLVEDKSRVGVCLDTCHVFAAGYDLRTPDSYKKTFDAFSNVIGLHYLCAMHLNDSKAPFASHRDLHQNIGLGFLGLRAFHSIMNDRRLYGLPLVLETPISNAEFGSKEEDKGIWAREIKLLEGLIDMDAESEEFQTLERELSEKGAAERRKHTQLQEKKLEKAKRTSGKTASKRSNPMNGEMPGSEDSDSG